MTVIYKNAHTLECIVMSGLILVIIVFFQWWLWNLLLCYCSGYKHDQGRRSCWSTSSYVLHSSWRTGHSQTSHRWVLGSKPIWSTSLQRSVSHQCSCHSISIWEFVYFVCGLSPPKRRVVRWRNFACRRMPTMCRTCDGFMSVGVVVMKIMIFFQNCMHIRLDFCCGE